MVNCPSKNAQYTGNCEYCNERTDCMLHDIFQKLQELTLAVAKKETA